MAIGFAVFTSLLCFALGKTHQVYYIICTFQRILRFSPLLCLPGESPSHSPSCPRKMLTCFVHVSISFFSKSKLIAISLTFSSKPFLARGRVRGTMSGLTLYTSCHHYLFLCLYHRSVVTSQPTLWSITTFRTENT